MGEQTYYTAIMTIFLFLVTAISASAFVSLDLSEGRCFDDGSFSFKVKNYGDTEVDLHSATITAAMRGARQDPFTPAGLFERDTLYKGSTYTTTTMFYSDTGNFNESGTYDLTLDYEGCKYDACEEKMTFERCPGFPYQCKLADLQINKCFERNGALRIYFTGINNGQYERINSLTELRVGMRSNSRTMMDTYFPPGATIKPLDDDEYIMSIPLRQGEHAYEASLELTRCSNPPYVREIAICTIEETPSTPSIQTAEVPPPQNKGTPSDSSVDDAKGEQKTSDSRAGMSKLTGHSTLNDITQEKTEESMNYGPLLTFFVVILWIAAVVLVTTLLVRAIKK